VDFMEAIPTRGWPEWMGEVLRVAEQAARQERARGLEVEEDVPLRVVERLAREPDPPLDREGAIRRVGLMVKWMALDEARVKARRRRILRERGGEERGAGGGRTHEGLELGDFLRVMMSSLSDEQQVVVRMRVLQGQTLEQIAEGTGLSVATVHRRYASAVKTMRSQLEERAKWDDAAAGFLEDA